MSSPSKAPAAVVRSSRRTSAALPRQVRVSGVRCVSGTCQVRVRYVADTARRRQQPAHVSGACRAARSVSGTCQVSGTRQVRVRYVADTRTWGPGACHARPIAHRPLRRVGQTPQDMVSRARGFVAAATNSPLLLRNVPRLNLSRARLAAPASGLALRCRAALATWLPCDNSYDRPRLRRCSSSCLFRCQLKRLALVSTRRRRRR
jgi:hypothetical protein